MPGQSDIRALAILAARACEENKFHRFRDHLDDAHRLVPAEAGTPEAIAHHRQVRDVFKKETGYDIDAMWLTGNRAIAVDR